MKTDNIVLWNLKIMRYMYLQTGKWMFVEMRLLHTFVQRQGKRVPLVVIQLYCLRFFLFTRIYYKRFSLKEMKPFRLTAGLFKNI